MPNFVPMIWCSVHGNTGGNGCPKCLVPSKFDTKSTCIICKGEIDSDIVHDDFEELYTQVDRFGMESATEQEQVVLEGCICSFECYEKLE